MTEELIPRDIPIYCLMQDNKTDRERAKQTRDVWTKRWGFTNFIPQQIFSILHCAEAIMEKTNFDSWYNNLISTTPTGLDAKFSMYFPTHQNSMIYSSNLYYLAKKLKTKKQHSIIITCNTLLQNDIPLSNLKNDITFFGLQNDSKQVNTKRGIMISRDYAQCFYDDGYKIFNQETEFFIKDYLKDNLELRSQKYDVFHFIKDNCVSNYKTLLEMNNEQMYGKIV